MKLIYASLTLFAYSAQSFGDCEWIHGDKGKLVECGPGRLITAACGSGYRANCKDGVLDRKSHTMIQCCPHTYDNDAENNCQVISGNYGTEITCNSASNSSPDNLSEMNGLCTSSNTRDCGPRGDKSASQIRCCNTSDVTVGPFEACGWYYGDSGETVKCPKEYAVTGFCGSGSNSDCGNKKAYVGVFCCPFKNNKA